MRVVASRIQRVEGKPTQPIGNARARWDRREGILLTLTDEQGRVGMGEASPLPGYSPDGVEDCARVLDGIAGRLLPTRDGIEPVEMVKTATSTVEEELEQTPAARFALETALLDLIGQRRGMAISECLGDKPSFERIEVNGTVSFSGRELSRDREDNRSVRAMEEIVSMVARGIRTLKIKVGNPSLDFEQELEALRRVRTALPEEVKLRLDANGAWTVPEARRNLERMVDIRPEFVEQPVAPGWLERLGPCAVPWAADESLRNNVEAERLLQTRECAAFVIKPAVVGGLIRARRLAVMAQERGLGVVITHLFDGPVALAAACELALSLPSEPLACGLDRHPGLGSWPAVEIRHLRRDGWVVRSGLSGLGLSKESRETLGWTMD